MHMDQLWNVRTQNMQIERKIVGFRGSTKSQTFVETFTDFIRAKNKTAIAIMKHIFCPSDGSRYCECYVMCLYKAEKNFF